MLTSSKPTATNQKESHQRSVWYYLDTLLCVTVLFLGAMVAVIYRYYEPVWMMSIPFLLVIQIAGKWYEKGIPHSQFFRCTTGILRAVLYIVAIGGMIFPRFLSSQDGKWAYRWKRELFLSSYTDKGQARLNILIPEYLPEKADEYDAKFMPKILQGSAMVDIFYYTESDVISGYKEQAKSFGAERFVEDANSEDGKGDKWFSYMRERNASANDMDGAEVYQFWNGYENTAVWMLNEKTGYFRVYY
jgi:hypothetical protein